jgi:dienelactone hydrolase
VRSAIVKPFDRVSLHLCKRSVHRSRTGDAHAAEAEALLHSHEFLNAPVKSSADVTFEGGRAFHFRSPLASRWQANNTVHGRLFRAGKDWPQRPTVVMLHGWNAEAGYRYLFPALAWRLTRANVNAAMIELPYHSRRKPTGANDVRNFISDDLLHVTQAIQQAVADARALIGWLREQGNPSVGLWGISLGAWLSGLLACAEPRVDWTVLMTPVVRMDRIIAEAEFCEPIRQRLNGLKIRLDPLNLISHQPRQDPRNILLVASRHDLFTPIETVEELWRQWHHPDIWRIPHGHISILMSAPIMARTVRWIAERAKSRTA